MSRSRRVAELVDRDVPKTYVVPALRYVCHVCRAERVLSSEAAPTGLLHCGRWAYAMPCDLPREGEA